MLYKWCFLFWHAGQQPGWCCVAWLVVSSRLLAVFFQVLVVRVGLASPSGESSRGERLTAEDSVLLCNWNPESGQKPADQGDKKAGHAGKSDAIPHSANQPGGPPAEVDCAVTINSKDFVSNICRGRKGYGESQLPLVAVAVAMARWEPSLLPLFKASLKYLRTNLYHQHQSCKVETVGLPMTAGTSES